MKFFAYIALVSLIFMGVNRFMHGLQPHVDAVEMACDMDCCDSHDDCEKEEDSQSDHQCPPGCDCDCCFHITAINYQFISVLAAEVQSHYYGSYLNNYQFEFLIPLFQPPRPA